MATIPPPIGIGAPLLEEAAKGLLCTEGPIGGTLGTPTGLPFSLTPDLPPAELPSLPPLPEVPEVPEVPQRRKTPVGAGPYVNEANEKYPLRFGGWKGKVYKDPDETSRKLAEAKATLEAAKKTKADAEAMLKAATETKADADATLEAASKTKAKAVDELLQAREKAARIIQDARGARRSRKHEEKRDLNKMSAVELKRLIARKRASNGRKQADKKRKYKRVDKLRSMAREAFGEDWRFDIEIASKDELIRALKERGLDVYK